MRTQRTVWRFVTHALDPLAFLAAFAALHAFHLSGHAGWWPAVPVLLGALQLQPGFQRWLGGGDVRRRALLRMNLLHVTALVLTYSIGWGPVLTVAFVYSTITHIRWSGAWIWRHSLITTTMMITVGQLAVAGGWVYCYLPSAQAHASAIFGGVASMLLIHMYGKSAEQREHAEASTRASEERFRALVQDACDAVALVDADGKVSYISPAMGHISGFSPHDVEQTQFAAWVYPDDLHGATALFAAAVADPGGQHRAELRIRHTDGGWRWVEATLRNLLDSPAVGGIVANFRDVTERRITQERLAYDANHDALTGLTNRAAFHRAVDEAVAAQRAGGPDVAVLFVDLDGFKQVNDVYGHGSGDELIIAVAAMLRRSIRDGDVVGRLGGDEFGVVLTGVEATHNATAVATRILAEMDRTLPLSDGCELRARASIGIAVGNGECFDSAELLRRADAAMYGAKRRETHSFQLYVDARQPAQVPG